MQRVRAKRCWCGSETLQPFAPNYLLCTVCQTLVSGARLPDEALRVTNDAGDFYGRRYWWEHQTEDLGYPNLEQRARADLAERCAQWLSVLLRWRAPPGRVLELGSAHGGFVALMRLAGFEATGLELSPSVVTWSQVAFGIPVLCGPLENQTIAPASLEAIVLMDVLEHLSDPLATMKLCRRLLAPGGIVLAQTPAWRGQDYSAMQSARDPFLEHFKPDEHLHLFSPQAARRLLAEAGLSHVTEEPAPFVHDMLLVASAEPLPTETSELTADRLLRAPAGRMALALLDAGVRSDDLARVCAARQRVIEEQQQEIELLRQACAERLALIEAQERELGPLRRGAGRSE
ncbi:MAG: class I SAM-dependent methyltransferase [Planctomycetota bacterium]